MKKNSMKKIKRLFRDKRVQRGNLFLADMIEVGLPQCAVMLNNLNHLIDIGELPTEKTTKEIMSDILYEYGKAVYPTVAHKSKLRQKHRGVEMGVLTEITLAATAGSYDTDERKSLYELMPTSARDLLKRMNIEDSILSGTYREAVGV